jgi:hypothetical protein
MATLQATFGLWRHLTLYADLVTILMSSAERTDVRRTIRVQFVRNERGAREESQCWQAFYRVRLLFFQRQLKWRTTMKNSETKSTTTRRCIYFTPDIAVRVDRLVEQGAMVSNVVNAALQQTLAGIEKRFKTGKPGDLRVRKYR